MIHLRTSSAQSRTNYSKTRYVCTQFIPICSRLWPLPLSKGSEAPQLKLKRRDISEPPSSKPHHNLTFWLYGVNSANGYTSIMAISRYKAMALSEPGRQSLGLCAYFDQEEGAWPETVFFSGQQQSIICELPCCITPATLQVLTRLGQVYERSAIERHISMSRSAGPTSTSYSSPRQGYGHSQPELVPTDPVTNMPLPDASLTPVYPMKSRAMSFRESRARACARRACTLGCSDPVRYLRRAVELAVGVADELRIPGLSSEVSLTCIKGHGAMDCRAVLPKTLLSAGEPKFFCPHQLQSSSDVFCFACDVSR